MHIRTWHLVLIPVAWLCQTAQAIDCSSPTLKGASGVIGNKHDYKIAGQCSKTWKETKTGAGSSTTVNTAVTFNYLGSASWDRASGEAQEKLKFTGDSAGTHYASAICTQDPFLKDPPGGAASCGTITVQVKVDAGEIYKPLLDKVFWASKRLSLAEAQALSAQAAATPAAGRQGRGQQGKHASVFAERRDSGEVRVAVERTGRGGIGACRSGGYGRQRCRPPATPGCRQPGGGDRTDGEGVCRIAPGHAAAGRRDACGHGQRTSDSAAGRGSPGNTNGDRGRVAGEIRRHPGRGRTGAGTVHGRVR